MSEHVIPRSSASVDVRPCDPADTDALLEVINRAAVIYEGAIPADCWHVPYMSREALAEEIQRGVRFYGLRAGDELVAIMGMQDVRNARLIRHAYVLPAYQGQGLGSILLRHCCLAQPPRPMLVGTWSAAHWAIAFYMRNGFAPVPAGCVLPLLRCYWDIPARQAHSSTVLAQPALTTEQVSGLIKGGGPAG